VKRVISLPGQAHLEQSAAQVANAEVEIQFDQRNVR